MGRTFPVHSARDNKDEFVDNSPLKIAQSFRIYRLPPPERPPPPCEPPRPPASLPPPCRSLPD
ncbi:MAG: hypothetical protein DMF69_17335, partial [Acidobacteria bacterium]